MIISLILSDYTQDSFAHKAIASNAKEEGQIDHFDSDNR